jgi:hypothetical protein
MKKERRENQGPSGGSNAIHAKTCHGLFCPHVEAIII